MSRRVVLVSLVIASSSVASAVVSPPAAAGPFRPCRTERTILCARVTVPLDRSAVMPGTVGLEVQRVPAPRRRRGAVLFLAGGPGEAATSATRALAEDFGPVLGDRELVVFDQRGTGGSGLLRCPSLERLGNDARITEEAEACAEQLGPRRAFYTTPDTVDDIEAVRRAVGVDRLSIVGVSYGTKVALAYALRYPERVERLALDSVLDPDAPDPFYRDTLRSSSRALGTLCRGPCSGITPDPTADLGEVAARLGEEPLRGSVVGADGVARPAELGGFEVVQLLLAGDLDPVLRAAIPAAVRSVRNGDTAPILRLARLQQQADRPLPPRLFSPAVFVTTVCEEAPLPWERTAPFDERPGQAAARAEQIDEAAFAPFRRKTALDSDILRICARWPLAEPVPVLGPGPLPDVPVLVLSGDQDLRTPLEGASRVTALFPRGRLLAVPRAGHAVLGSDSTGCAGRALRGFLSNQSVPRHCAGRPPLAPRLARPDPTSLGQVRPAPGVPGRLGRVLTGTVLTVDDVDTQATRTLLGSGLVGRPGVGGGGLRGGRFRLSAGKLRLDGIVYVPGLRVSGTLRIGAELIGRLHVSAADGSGGTLDFRPRGVVTGRLAGRPVRARLPVDAGIDQAEPSG